MSWAQRSMAFMEKHRESSAAISKISFQAPLAPHGPSTGHVRNKHQHCVWEHVFGLLRLFPAAPVKGATEDPSWVARCVCGALLLPCSSSYPEGRALGKLLWAKYRCLILKPVQGWTVPCRCGQGVGRVMRTTPHASLGICTVEGSAPSCSLCSTL